MSLRQFFIDYLTRRKHMQRYVSTVILSADLKQVVTIRKDHGPKHLIGKLNAVGGSIEPGESLFDAAVREVKEESDLTINKASLQMLGSLSDVDYTWDVACFMTLLSPATLAKAKTMTSETVEVWDVADLLAEPSVDPDFLHMLYEALRLASKTLIYDGSHGKRFG